MITILRSTTNYASVRDFVMQALDPTDSFRDEVKRGDLYPENAWEVAEEYLQFYVKDGSLEAFEGTDDDIDWNETRFTTDDLEAYLLDLIAEQTTLAPSEG